jgi:hypothetical protein
MEIRMDLDTVLRLEKEVAGLQHHETVAISSSELFELCEIARRALQSAAPEALCIPEGWKLVPEIPTEAMIEACGMVLASDDVAFAWRAMLRCAPSPLVTPAAAKR